MTAPGGVEGSSPTTARTGRSISVVVVDDHPVVRSGILSLLGTCDDIEVVGEAAGCEAGFLAIRSTKPQVAVVDVRLPDGSGLDLARRVLRLADAPRVLILSSYDDDEYVQRAAALGVGGYLLKSSSPQVLADAVRSVAAGASFVSPEVGAKAFAAMAAAGQQVAALKSGLINTDIVMLEHLAMGESTAEMAEALAMSERTIKRRVQDVLDKLGAASRAQAVAEGFRRGLL